jgi:hypothetical protein
MEVHDLVPELDALGCKPCHLSFQIVHGEADMVEPEFGEVANSGVGDQGGGILVTAPPFAARRWRARA